MDGCGGKFFLIDLAPSKNTSLNFCIQNKPPTPHLWRIVLLLGCIIKFDVSGGPCLQ